MKINYLKYLSILFFAPLMACSEVSNEDGSMTSDKPAIDYRQQIDNAIADKSCRSDADCALVEVGAKPCGGPET